jgi:cytochrome-b5 reductase
MLGVPSCRFARRGVPAAAAAARRWLQLQPARPAEGPAGAARARRDGAGAAGGAALALLAVGGAGGAVALSEAGAAGGGASAAAGGEEGAAAAAKARVQALTNDAYEWGAKVQTAVTAKRDSWAAYAEQGLGSANQQVRALLQLQPRSELAAHQRARSDDFFPVTVIANKALGPNTRLLRLQLESSDAALEYRFGSYVTLRGLSLAVDESFPFGKLVEREYLPLQPLDRRGHFDVIVKTYAWPGGDCSRFLAAARPGDTLEARGPVRRPVLEALIAPPTEASATAAAGAAPSPPPPPLQPPLPPPPPPRSTHLAIVTGGSGTAAAIQLVRSVLGADVRGRPPRRTGKGSEAPPALTITVLASDRGPDDLFYVSELQRLSSKFPGRLTVHRTLTRDAPRGWRHSTGRVSAEMIKKHLPAPGPGVVVLVCGPDGFCRHLAGPGAAPNLRDTRAVPAPAEQPPAHAFEAGLLRTLGYDRVAVL